MIIYINNRMNILIIKSIFCPDKCNFEKTKSSLIKLDRFLKTKGILYDLYIVGWIGNYIDEIEDVLNTNICGYHRIYKEFWKMNYGKYMILNQIKNHLDKSPENYDILLYFDHDVYIDSNCSNAIKHIRKLYRNKIKGKRIGLIIFNQKEDIRHHPDIYKNTFVIDDIKICYSEHKNLLATGGFAIDANIYKNIILLKLISVYGFDDYFLIKLIDDMKYENIMLQDTYIIHPFDDNVLYSKWKQNIISEISKNFNQNLYYDTIENSIKFWSTYR